MTSQVPQSTCYWHSWQLGNLTTPMTLYSSFLWTIHSIKTSRWPAIKWYERRLLYWSFSDILWYCSFRDRISSQYVPFCWARTTAMIIVNSSFIFTFRRFWQVGQSGGQREQNLWFMETWFMQIVHHWYSENMPKVIMFMMIIYSKQGHAAAAYLWWRTRIKALLHSHIPAMPAKTTLL